MSNRPVSHKLHTQINSYFTEVWLRHHGASLLTLKRRFFGTEFFSTYHVRAHLCSGLYSRMQTFFLQLGILPACCEQPARRTCVPLMHCELPTCCRV